MFKRFPFYEQLDAMDCGPTCLKMIAEYYGQNHSIEFLRSQSFLSRTGVSVKGIMEAAETIGLRGVPVKIPFISNEHDVPGFEDVPLPCIVHWEQRHFIVVYKYSNKFVWVADPGLGRIKLTHKEFRRKWESDGDMGVALLLETTPTFFEQEGRKQESKGLGYLFSYLRPYRKLIIQLILGLFVGSLFQLIIPFLTQSIVDIGIENQDIDFIWLILISQLMIFVGQTSLEVIQSWILLHISTRINVSLISDFLSKLMRLPIKFFDTKLIGDLLQRINDHTRIEAFLTSSSLSIIFSMVNFIVFGLVLIIYNVNIFLIFLISSILFIAWIFFFLKKRKEVDYQKFNELAENQNTLIEMIHGMQEIKLQNSEVKHRRKWTNVQAKLFHANIRSLSITQYQDIGANGISYIKDILISFIAAKAVIDGQMTLGMMLAVQYIVGQLNAPLRQLIDFVRQAQDANISLERLGEVHDMEDEKDTQHKIEFVPSMAPIEINNVSFRYNQLDDFVLKDISLTIPPGKVTAIVGTSGSGKTTLIKLLLGFYTPEEGQIKIGRVQLNKIDDQLWRQKCGAVMQDGFIFSETIATNIAISEERVDREKLLRSVKMANIQEFIEDQPLGYNTMIGAKGNGISQGQKQRLLMARAIYKNPDFLFFDEATNALDTKNERKIVDNLKQFYTNKTVVVVAHRLSTVKDADQIVVLDKGEIAELGTHDELVKLKGKYFNLVSAQLELGT